MSTVTPREESLRFQLRFLQWTFVGLLLIYLFSLVWYAAKVDEMETRMRESKVERSELRVRLEEVRELLESCGE